MEPRSLSAAVEERYVFRVSSGSVYRGAREFAPGTDFFPSDNRTPHFVQWGRALRRRAVISIPRWPAGEASVRMTTEEAFIKVLQLHGIEHAFGIIGSAMMPVSDLFSRAGITFWDCAHEANAGLMCDGYSRATGRIAMAIAQNGPGVTGFVTAVKTAYWNHTPMLLVTPQAANKTMGQGGFQEVPQMALFQDMVCWQEEVRDPSRIAEALNRVIAKALRGGAPAQINVPRDFWTHVIDVELPQVVRFERPAGGKKAIAEAARMLSDAAFPVILNGAGVVLAGAIPQTIALAERLDAPVCSGYQHNDSFPGSHPLATGPLGYNGSKAAMELIAKADVVLALGTRLNPFSTLPGYGIDYWPRAAKMIQVDMNADRIGLTKKVSIGICGDAKQVAEQILAQLSPAAGDRGRAERKGADPSDQVRLAAAALLDGSRGRRSRHCLERRRPGARGRSHVAASGLARDPGGVAARRDHLLGHRQQLRDRQRLSHLRAGAEISGAGPVRPLRLWLPLDRRGEDRLPRHAGRRLRRRRRLRHFDERNDVDRSRGLAGHHDGHFPQLPMGRGKAQHDALVRRQFRRHRAEPESELRENRRGLRIRGRRGRRRRPNSPPRCAAPARSR